jgi:hypothetical protein
MTDSLVIRELSVVIAGRHHNPSILNPDFLKFNDIVPTDWHLAQPPFCTDMISQVAFANGVAVVSQQDKITFSNSFSADGSGAMEVPGVALRYLRTVPHVAYDAVGVNPKGHLSFDSAEAALACVQDTFLAGGPWLDFGNGLRQAGIRFVFDLVGCILSLSVDTAIFTDNEIVTPVVVFAGNLHHTLKGDTTKERLESAVDMVSKWEEDVKMFRDLVEGRILNEKAKCN